MALSGSNINNARSRWMAMNQRWVAFKSLLANTHWQFHLDREGSCKEEVEFIPSLTPTSIRANNSNQMTGTARQEKNGQPCDCHRTHSDGSQEGQVTTVAVKAQQWVRLGNHGNGWVPINGALVTSTWCNLITTRYNGIWRITPVQERFDIPDGAALQTF